MNRNRLKILIFIALAGITAGTALVMERYQDQGPELLANNVFAEGLADWQVRGHQDGVQLRATGVLRLTGQGDGQPLEVRQPLAAPPPGTLLRLRGDLHSEKIIPGKKSWHTGRLVLASYDQEGRGLPVSHVVAALTGSVAWREYARVFQVPTGAATIKVAVQLHQTMGLLEARRLSLHRVGETGWYPWLRWGVLALWLLFMSLVFVPAYFPDRGLLTRRAGALPLLLIFLIILGTTIPGSLERQVAHDLETGVEGVADLVGKSRTGQAIVEWSQADKFRRHLPESNELAHFGLFAALAALTLICCPAKPWPPLIGDLLLLAGGTELMQMYVDGRNPRWTDLGTDLYGGAIGILVGIGWLFWWRRRLGRLRRRQAPASTSTTDSS
jgi:hypothetical protein